MKPNPYKGKFIVFEGLDGSGNTTQASRLFEYLQRSRKPVHFTREPTNYLIGGLIRSHLGHDWKSGPECLQLLFAADRAHHLEKEVTPLLKKGITVISDRYVLSSLAYGPVRVKDGLGEWLKDVNSRFLLPDITFLMKVRAAVSLGERIQKRRFSIELFEERGKLNQVWRNYQALARQFKNVVIVNGERDKDLITEEIIGILQKRIII